MENVMKANNINKKRRESRMHVHKGNDPTKFYTKGEEVFNCLTHGVGSLCAIVGTAVMVTLAAVYSDWRAVCIALVYGFSLIALYTMSTLYHAFPQAKIKCTLRIFDHTSIYLLIAGSYTPLALIPLRNSYKGVIICGAVWLLAILGIVLNCISVTKFSKISMLLYVGMGWAVVFAFGDIVRVLPPVAFWLLLLGGVCYTGGIVFYRWNRVKYMHGVWHLFVLAGSVLHYICVVCYVMPMIYTK